MPRWKPKTIHEKFLAELTKLDRKISAKQVELVELESTRKQLESAVAALTEADHVQIKAIGQESFNRGITK